MASMSVVCAYVAACGGRRWAAAQARRPRPPSPPPSLPPTLLPPLTPCPRPSLQAALLLAERVTFLSTDYMLTTWTAAASGPPDTVFGRLMHGPPADWHGPVRGASSAAAFYAAAYALCAAVNAIFAAARTQATTRRAPRRARL